MNNLRIVKLNKFYGKNNEYNILNNLNLQFIEGKTYCIYGNSGCGKTTLLNIISLLDTNYEGEILYNGVNIKDIEDVEPNSYKKYIVSFIKQDNVLFDILNSQENINLSCLETINNKKSSGKINVKKLSGGQYKRVAIEQVLNKECKILLADEPTANLDDNNSVLVMEKLKEFTKDKIFVFVTHNQNIANKFADEILYMDNGKIKRNYKRKIKDEEFDIHKIRKISKRNIKKGSKIFLIRNIKFTSLFNNSLICLLISLTTLLSMYFGLKTFLDEQIRFTDDLTYISLKQPCAESNINDEDVKYIIENTGQQNIAKIYENEDNVEAYICNVPFTFNSYFLCTPNEVYSKEISEEKIILKLNYNYKELMEDYLQIESFDDIDFSTQLFSLKFNNQIYEFNIIDILWDENCENISLLHSNPAFYEQFFTETDKYVYGIENSLLTPDFIKWINNDYNYSIKVAKDYSILYKGDDFYLNENYLRKIDTSYIPLYENNEYIVNYSEGLFYFNELSIDRYQGEQNLLYYTPYTNTLKLGRHPSASNEISISSNLADKIGLTQPGNVILTYKNIDTLYKVTGIFINEDNYIHINPEFLDSIFNTTIGDQAGKPKTFSALFFVNPNKVEKTMESLKNLYPRSNIFSPVFETLTTIKNTTNNILNIGSVFIFILAIITVFSVYLITKLEIEQIEKPINHLCSLGYDKKELNKILIRVLLKRMLLSFLISQITGIIFCGLINKIIQTELTIESEIVSYNFVVFLFNLVISLITILITYNLQKFKKIKTQG